MLVADTWSESAVAIVAVAFLFTGIAAIVGILIWQGFGLWQARVTVAREGAYRELAERATLAQEKTAHAVEKTVDELSDLRQRTSELERVLKEVG